MRAPPPGFSQLTASFLAALCLGIPRVPFSTLDRKYPSVSQNRSLRTTKRSLETSPVHLAFAHATPAVLPFLCLAELTPKRRIPQSLLLPSRENAAQPEQRMHTRIDALLLFPLYPNCQIKLLPTLCVRH